MKMIKPDDRQNVICLLSGFNCVRPELKLACYKKPKLDVFDKPLI